MSVLSVMRNLKSEVDAGSIKPYCLVEINGLKLASPENIYSVRIHDTSFTLQYLMCTCFYLFTGVIISR